MMTDPYEKIAETAGVLAAQLIRLRERKGSQAAGAQARACADALTDLARDFEKQHRDQLLMKQLEEVKPS